MLAPAKPANEAARLQALLALKILDTEPEERFDRITRMAKRMFDVPMALVSLVDRDRQWFKSRQGLDVCETPREISFCGHAVLNDELLVVPDATRDPRFADNPIVEGEPCVRFYAGQPLRTRDGFPIGTLCVIDLRPRELTDEDLVLLQDLASMVEHELTALRLATTDELTGLSNRRGFDAIAAHSLALSERVGLPVTLLYLDLDKFKQINDTLGHAAGDDAIITFSRALLYTFRSADVVARVGGDEFVVLCSGAEVQDTDGPLVRLRETIDDLLAASSAEYELSFSVGKEPYDPEVHSRLGDLVSAADQAMYAAKRGDAPA